MANTVSDFWAWQQANAFQSAADAQRATAEAQRALVDVTARTNQIIQQAEHDRKKLLQDQFEEQERAHKQERFAKGLLVQAEVDIQSSDISKMEYDDLSAHVGRMNSLLDFADNKRLLIDFFETVDDIRFAQKTIRDVKAHLELANAVLAKARGKLERERLRDIVESMKEALGPYIEKSDELRDVAPNQDKPQEREMFYAQQLCLHSAHLHWIRMNLGQAETLLPEINSGFETIVQQIESDIRKTSSQLSSESSREIKEIIPKMSDFSTLIDRTYWQQFDPEHTEPIEFDHLCPVCNGPVNVAKLPTDPKERSEFLVYCRIRSPVNGPHQLHSIRSDKLNHYYIKTSDYDVIQQILESKSRYLKSEPSSLKSRIKILESKHMDDLVDIENEIETSRIYQKRKLRKRRDQMKREYNTEHERLSLLIPTESAREINDEALKDIRETIKSEGRKENKDFRKYTQAYENLLMRCFGHIPGKPIDLVELVKRRRHWIQQLAFPEFPQFTQPPAEEPPAEEPPSAKTPQTAGSERRDRSVFYRSMTPEMITARRKIPDLTDEQIQNILQAGIPGRTYRPSEVQQYRDAIQVLPNTPVQTRLTDYM